MTPIEIPDTPGSAGPTAGPSTPDLISRSEAVLRKTAPEASRRPYDPSGPSRQAPYDPSKGPAALTPPASPLPPTTPVLFITDVGNYSVVSYQDPSNVNGNVPPDTNLTSNGVHLNYPTDVMVDSSGQAPGVTASMKVITGLGSQSSTAVASPVLDWSVEASHWTVTSEGQLIVGGVVS